MGGLIRIGLLLAAAAAFGFGRAEEAADLTGRIAITGNEPHAVLTLVTDEASYVLEGDPSILDELASDYQQRLIEVWGEITGEARGHAIPGTFRVESFSPANE